MSSTSSKRAVIAACIGNFSEWYDFALFGFFAVVLSRVFYPGGSDLAGMLATFATFGVAFFFRPIGAFVLGRFGDHRGRKNVLSAVVLVTSGATFLIGVLPGYATIGWAAPVLLITLRIVQGLALGGELGGALTMLAEFAPPRRRGLYTSWAAVGSNTGMAVGAVIALVIQLVASRATLDAWAWRIPFLLALPIGLSGLYLRLKVAETPAFVAARRAATEAAQIAPERPAAPTRAAVLRPALQLIGTVVAWTVITYIVTTFIPSFLTKEHGLAGWVATLMALSGLLVAIAATPIAGLLSDRVGRRPVLVGASVLLAVGAVPMTLLFDLGIGGVLAALVGMGVVLGGYNGAAPAAVTELVPTNIRYTLVGTAYQISVALFGATAPFVLTLLVARTGPLLAPGLYLLVAALITGAAAWSLSESAFRPLHGTAAATEPAAVPA